ncbi:MAG: PaaI family thioesterase [Myxococcota bacterium]|nr:PaaI family thioesterase [Myxococcota bacterium]MDW8363587.1 PaaI family thioesterase [Myxococcales bacterium]
MSERLARALAEARAVGDPDRLVAAIPYCRWLGVQASLQDGRLVASLPFRQMLVGNPVLPALHGGVLGALLESVAVLEWLWTAPEAVLPRPINLTVAFLRSARPETTHANASIVRQGRRVVSMRAQAWQSDRDAPVAVAMGQLLVAADPRAG